MYEKVVQERDEEKWDLSVDSLKQRILSLDEDHPEKQELLEQLNQNINQLTLQPIIPSEQTTYLVWSVDDRMNAKMNKRFFASSYDIVNQFIDSFVDQMILTHQKLQINEPSSESYPDVDLCK